MPDFEWRKDDHSVVLAVPKEFSFIETLKVLARSDDECLHIVENNRLYKVLKLDGLLVLLEISYQGDGLSLRFLNTQPPEAACRTAIDYLSQWFDLETDLRPFYRLAGRDGILGDLVQRYYGLRLIGIPDLFESLCWAVIGQQINLSFAYTLKRRFVEAFGQKLIHRNQTYWAFPSPEQVSDLRVADLRSLQFSDRKAEYVIGIADKIRRGDLSKAQLCQLDDFEQMQRTLVEVRGVGHWTANYVLMKCFRQPTAFPIDDVGLHNAIKQELGLDQKPSRQEIRQLFSPWRGWEAYSTFYLWRALII